MMDRFFLKTLIEFELCDTYGGDYTYESIFYSTENEELKFYVEYYGALAEDICEIDDESKIEYYKSLIKNKIPR